MKLGYRDRVIILVSLVVIIIGVGIFVFIKPKWQKLNQNKQNLANAENEWNMKMLDFDKINVRRDNINKKYVEAGKIADEFTDEMTSVELEEFLQAQFVNNDKFKEDEVEIKQSFSTSDEQSASLNYYYLTPNIVTYPLFEAADLDGSLANAAKQIMRESDVLSSRATQSVGSGQSSFTLLINREDTMALLDSVKDYAAAHKDAMLINSVTIKDYDFNKNVEEEEGAAKQPAQQEEPAEGEGAEGEGAEGEGDDNAAANTDEQKTRVILKVQKDGNNANVKKDYTEVTITYTAYYMQEPTQPSVGPEYDKTIWDGDAWRTAVVE